jgi:hypothetical protein
MQAIVESLQTIWIQLDSGSYIVRLTFVPNPGQFEVCVRECRRDAMHRWLIR